MPILQPDPWRGQFFEAIECPEDVVVPTKDWQAWTMFPEHRWIYNKLTVALSQGLEAAPHGVIPPDFPIFSKPIYNLRSMGSGSLPISDLKTYKRCLTAGHFWTTLLTGVHVSTDAAIVDGKVRWWRHATGVPGQGGTFHYWQIHAKELPEIEDWCGGWIFQHLAGYTGMMNLETIGGRIIEAHLRFSDQWPDLYGPGWLKAIVHLYSAKEWVYDDSERREGFSVVLFGPHGQRYGHPPIEALKEAKSVKGVLSISIPFDADIEPDMHSMPPGGFRLAVINSTTL